MEEWDDKITALEMVTSNITDRLTSVEEILLGKLHIYIFKLCSISFNTCCLSSNLQRISEPWVACVSSPCDNGGSCIDVNVDTFICMCRTGYYGDMCQYSK